MATVYSMQSASGIIAALPSLQNPMDWLNTSIGESLFRQECDCAREALETVFGDQIVQIGTWGPPHELLAPARTQFSAVLGLARHDAVDAFSAPTRLAVLTDSVDAVMLPHTLEFVGDPHGVLREVHRILRPDGKLIVLGFNPASWWGLRHRVTRGFPPGAHQHVSRTRLTDLLRLLNMSVDSIRSCYARPPENRLMTVMKSSGWFASAYLLVATKDTVPLTIIRPSLHRRPRLVGSFANPTTRNVA